MQSKLWHIHFLNPRFKVWNLERGRKISDRYSHSDILNHTRSQKLPKPTLKTLPVPGNSDKQSVIFFFFILKADSVLFSKTSSLQCYGVYNVCFCENLIFVNYNGIYFIKHRMHGCFKLTHVIFITWMGCYNKESKEKLWRKFSSIFNKFFWGG